MIKPIIGIDLDGTLISEIPSKQAHTEWFAIMSSVLGDPAVQNYADLEGDYFPHVFKVMEQYTGLQIKEHKELLTHFARTLFQMSYIGQAFQMKDKLLYTPFATYLRKLKEKYTLALITTAPEDAVMPLLGMVDCLDLFSIVYKGPIGKKSDKTILLKQFIKEHGKPICYIGNEDGDVQACLKTNVKSILVNWNNTELENVEPDYTVCNVEELNGVISKLEGLNPPT
ncbi:hypothetical protein CL622_07960 [archaeon]|nr:hypothetical protein [archaeon]|tara:strand:+ start:1961 stop:2641 length:681 start_codon:yes stop_codon:yes gene_type:complete